jgi:hypothetical protein
MKNLKMLFKLRAWLKSDTLKVGGAVGILGAAQTWLKTDEGMGILDMLANAIGLTSGTFSGVVIGLVGVLMLLFRAKTEWGLNEKVEGKDKGFTRLVFLGVLVLCSLFSLSAMADSKTFSWANPTEYENGEPLTLSEFVRYDLGCGPVSGDRSTIVRTWIATGTDAREEAFTAVGPYFCALNITATGTVTDNQPATSEWSNEVSFTVAPTKPNPVTNLTVE